MSKDNDRSDNPRDDNNETKETPGSFREVYLKAMSQNRPGSRSNDASQNDTSETSSRPGERPRPRSGAGGGRIYEEGNEQPTRPRPTRQSRDEVYSRLRQRPRQPVYSRNQGEISSQPSVRPNKTEQPTPSRREPGDAYPYQQPVPARTQQTTSRNAPPDPGYREDEYDEEEYNEYDDYEIVRRRRQPSPRPAPPRRGKRSRRGRVVSSILTGCLGGFITLVVATGVIAYLVLHNTSLGTSLNLGKSTYTRQENQPLALNNATQLIIKNQFGNVSISIDQNASSGTLTSTRKVLASSQSEANNQFNQIILTAKPVNQASDSACLASTCLLIAATMPTTASGGILGGGNGASIDLTVTLPASFNSLDQGTTPNSIDASTTLGTLSVNKFNGILNLSGSNGNVNISVTNSLIFAGTCFQTTHGNIVVNNNSIFDLNNPSQRVPCTNTTSSSDHPWFNVKSGAGNVDITLTSLSTNLLLDASTNNGKITDDFGLNIATCDGSPCYHGQLIPNTNSAASLYVSTSTGDINIHKQ